MNSKANGALMAIDLMQGFAPELDDSPEAIAECRRVLALHGYYLKKEPRLRAVRGVDEEGREVEAI